MKKKNLKKLVLAKETVAWLTKEESEQVRGAGVTSEAYPCQGACPGSVLHNTNCYC